MFVRTTFWLVLCLFFVDIAQPGHFKFWQPNIELSNINFRLPFLNSKKNTPTISPQKSSTCLPPDNDLEAILQARFGCDNETSN